MTTVVLTPTHMACDHHVVHSTFPTKSVVDLSHKKIFISPSRLIMVGMSGEFEPSAVDRPATWNSFGMLLADLLSQQIHENTKISRFVLDLTADYTRYLVDIIDPGAHTFIVTRSHRFVLKFSVLFKEWRAVPVGDYAGFGSGGAAAVGLLEAGMPLTEIWPHIHAIDKLTSLEHTIIPLRSLKSDRLFNSRIKKITEAKK